MRKAQIETALVYQGEAGMRLSSFAVILCVTAVARAGHAVCLDPKTDISGYHIPLNEEVRSSAAIAVGKVTQARNLREDASDPQGATATVYSVEISRQLKGRLPRSVELRSENDSGRYWMEKGETHILFFRHQKPPLSIDSCGNSSVLPKGDGTLKAVEAQLGATPNVR